MIIKNTDRALSLIACLIPLALLTGSFLPDLFIVLINILFLYIVFKKKDFIYFNNIFFKFFLTFYIYLIFSSLISEFPFFSLKSSLVYIRFGIFSIAIWYIIENNKSFLKLFTYSLFFAFSIAILNGYYQYIFNETIFGGSIPADRLLLLFSEKAALGNYLARLFPFLMAMYLIFFKKSNFSILILLLIFIFLDVLIFLSGERTALGLLMFSSLFILLMVNSFQKLRLISILVSLLIISAISIFSPSIKERNIDYTINQLGLNQGVENLTIFSHVHEAHIFTAYNMFKKNYLFGVGPNNFRNLCDDKNYKNGDRACSTHPHHLYIQLLAEVGLIGFLFFSIPISYLLYNIYIHLIYKYFNRMTILSDYQICLIAAFLCTIFPFLPSFNFFNNWINIIFYLPVGFFLREVYSFKDT